MSYKHICNFCGKEYENYFKKSKYCSSKCYDEYRKINAKLKEKICPVCGNYFKPRNSGAVYCSRECSGKSRQKRILCVCESCGKSFKRIESEVNKNSMHFCSNKCRMNYICWSKEDEQILLDNYGTMSYDAIASLLNRDVDACGVKRKAFDMGITNQANIWTDEEIQILISNYCTRPMSEVLEMLPNRTIYAVLGQARKYDLKSYFYLNRSYSDDEIEYIKNNYIDKTYDEMSNELGRTVNAIKIRMGILGLRKPTEIANYNNLYNYVRQRIVPWRNSIRESRGYTCEVSGKKSNIIVHHTRSFNLLFEECIDILDFPIKEDFGLYTQNELNIFVETFLEIQEHYGAYVCISEDVHKEFHSMYGYGDNTQEQWDEFVLSYDRVH